MVLRLYKLYNLINGRLPYIRESKCNTGGNTMEKYVCDVCGYVYDPEVGDPDNGVAPGTAWADVPEDWVCPLCGVGKDSFSAE